MFSFWDHRLILETKEIRDIQKIDIKDGLEERYRYEKDDSYYRTEIILIS